MKKSKKRAARHKRAAYKVKATDTFGRLIKAEANDNKLTAMIAVNKAARLTGKRIDWDTITVSPNR